MRRFLYHFVRIIAILTLASIYAVLLYIIADKGKWVKLVLVGIMGLVSMFTLAHWLYSGYFVRSSFRSFLSWFWKYRLRKHFWSSLIGFVVGICVVAAMLFAKGNNQLSHPEFYIITLGLGLLILLLNILSGYIKYCYRRHGNQRE